MALIDLPNFSQILIGSVIWVSLYYVYWQLTLGTTRRRLSKKHGCKPIKKLPLLDPILGLDLVRTQKKNRREHKVLEAGVKRFEELGNTFELKSMGRYITVTNEPENLKSIQSLQFKNWSLGTSRKLAFHPLLGHGIFTTDGAAWQNSREMLRPNFVRSQVGDLQTFETHVENLIHAIPRDHSTVDLQELFFRLTIDSATEFLFGESTNCLAQGTYTESNSRFAEAFNRSQDFIGDNHRLGFLARLLPNQQFQEDCKYVHDFVDTYVEKALTSRTLHDPEKGDDRYVFSRELATQTQDKERIRSELLNVLLAGRDTTASLLSNVWFELAKRPDIWMKLQEEISHLDGERPSFAQIKELKYLRYVFNESLRLYPVVPLNSREAIVDTVLPLGGGADGKSPMFIPKGQLVAWNLYAMHRRTDYYGSDANEFKPERWVTLRPGWEYLPFNGGPRICIGQQFALTEASYTTVRLLQEFSKIETRDPSPWRESLMLTCTGAGGAKVSLTPRVGEKSG